MPDSKLVEKLGFRVTENGDVVNLATGFFIINEQSIRSLGSEKTCRIALWNLCLELSERPIDREREKMQFLAGAEYGYRLTETGYALTQIIDETSEHFDKILKDCDDYEAEKLADPERKDA